MSQVTEQSVRFQTALASIKLIQASAVLDLTEDDFDFLTRSEERFSRNAETDLVCRLLLEKKKEDERQMPDDVADSGLDLNDRITIRRNIDCREWVSSA